MLNVQEVASLMHEIAWDLNYSTVYSRSNLFKKGDSIQKEILGDPISITMAGQVPGCVRSRCFDSDGLSLRDIRILENGKALNYYGSNRNGQYLKENPTGALQCLCVDTGSATAEDFRTGPYLEVISMSGLQVDLNNDYIGGEVRLAYYHDGKEIIPVTGISITGQVRDVLNNLRLSTEKAIQKGYSGPRKALLNCMKIF